jgi:hypothetical protein
MLCEVASAAYFLDIKQLVNLTCRAIAMLISGARVCVWFFLFFSFLFFSFSVQIGVPRLVCSLMCIFAISGKSTEEIRKTFGISEDLLPNQDTTTTNNSIVNKVVPNVQTNSAQLPSNSKVSSSHHHDHDQHSAPSSTQSTSARITIETAPATIRKPLIVSDISSKISAPVLPSQTTSSTVPSTSFFLLQPIRVPPQS